MTAALEILSRTSLPNSLCCCSSCSFLALFLMRGDATGTSTTTTGPLPEVWGVSSPWPLLEVTGTSAGWSPLEVRGTSGEVRETLRDWSLLGWQPTNQPSRLHSSWLFNYNKDDKLCCFLAMGLSFRAITESYVWRNKLLLEPFIVVTNLKAGLHSSSEPGHFPGAVAYERLRNGHVADIKFFRFFHILYCWIDNFCWKKYLIVAICLSAKKT